MTVLWLCCDCAVTDWCTQSIVVPDSRRQALCVKPSCAGCVGCNSVFCGYRAIDLPAEERIKRTLLAPEQFAVLFA